MNRPAPGDSELHDGVLALRPWCMHDAPPLLAAVTASKQALRRWLPWCYDGYAIDDSRHWIDHASHAWQAGSEFAFAVFDDGELVGGCGLSRVDPDQRNANLGYWLATSATGHGLAVRAARRICTFGFDNLGLIRIEIAVAQANQRSLRTAERLGARFEGTARNRILLGGRPQAAAVYGLIAGDLARPASPDLPVSPSDQEPDP